MTGDGDADGMHCPEDSCDRTDLDPRGFQQHLIQSHGWGKELAKSAFKAEKDMHAARNPVQPAGRGDSGGGDGGGGGTASAAGPLGIETSVTAADDPEIARLDSELERTRRLVQLQRLESMLGEEDDGTDDFLETVEKLKTLGVIGDDDDDGSDRALYQEIRRLRQDMQSAGGEADVSIQADSGDPLTAALAAGISDTEVIGALAESTPEVKKAELDYEREMARYDRREAMIEKVFDRLSDGSLLSTAVEAVMQARQAADDDDGDGGGIGGGGIDALEAVGEAAESTPEPTHADEDPQAATEVTPAELPHIEPDEPADADAEPAASPARERYAPDVAEADGGELSPTGEFRGPPAKGGHTGGEKEDDKQ